MWYLRSVRLGMRKAGVGRGKIPALLLCGLLASSAVVSAATLSGDYEELPYVDGPTNSLTQDGTLDWGHWGLVTEFTYNHKYGVAQQIRYSFITDFIDYPDWDGPFRLDWRIGGISFFGWTDGTPARANEGNSEGLSIYGDKLQPNNTPTGFHIECPADTSPRTLRVYVGNSFGAATVTASLNGAPTYTDIYQDAPGTRVYTVTFQADSPGQTLSFDFTSLDHFWYITLQAATLAGTNAPPSVTITAPADGTVYSAPATFALTASATDADGTVTNLSLFRDSTLLKQSTSGVLSASLNNQPAGAYDFFAVAKDNVGLSMTSFPVRVYVKANGGMLTGSVEPPPPTADLTAEGTTDWAHWGVNPPASFERKSGVTPLIPDLVLLNAPTSQLTNFDDSLISYYWSDGTPVPEAFGTATGVYLYATNPPLPGFQLTVPATSTPRCLKVYLGLSYAQGRLEAWLSDFSALPYSDASLIQAENSDCAVYTLTFASPNPGADLVVRWTPAEIFHMFYANVNWQAATLSGAAAPPAPPRLRVVRPPSATNSCALAFSAPTGATYTVQWIAVLGSTNWQALTNLSGTGGDVVVTDPALGLSRRFYRVLVQ